MFRQRLFQLSLTLFCFCFLYAPTSHPNVLAHSLSPHLAPATSSSPSAGSGGSISAVSIQAANNILYTGNGIDPSNYLLVRRWNGKTFDAPLHSAPYKLSDGGQAILSLSPTQTWLIANGLSDQNPLRIIYLNGSTQTTYPSPPLHGVVVNAMAAVNSSDIWAVGSSGPLINTFTMHWNGKNWQRIASPNIANKYNSLWGISARATNDVWAVGSQEGKNGGDIPLIMHWNGKAWSISPNPSVKNLPAHALNAVTIVAQNDVWAIGLGGLIEHWNGTQWRIVSSPIANSNFLSLDAISALAANNIWAVGHIISCPSSGSCISKTYTTHWNGSAWQAISSPSLSIPHQTTNNMLLGVRIFAANNVWAIGKTEDLVFLVHWNGSIWQITTSHNTYF